MLGRLLSHRRRKTLHGTFTLINLPQENQEKIYQDEKLGFFLTALTCTKTPDPYLAFEKATKDPIFKENFQNLPM